MSCSCGTCSPSPANDNISYQIGSTERETVFNQLRYMSNKYNDLAKFVGALSKVINCVHQFIGLNVPEAHRAPLLMMLDGMLGAMRLRICDIKNHMASADKFIAEADGTEPVRFEPKVSIAKSDSKEIDSEVIKGFYDAIDALLNTRTVIQKFYDRFYPDRGLAVQMKLDVIDPKEQCNVKCVDLDLYGYIEKLMQHAVTAKIEDGEATGIDTGEEKKDGDQDTPAQLSS